jgi:hypothetical protein
LHEAIAGADHGGVGPGVSPATALAVGLKVDADALPRALRKQLARGEVDLDDPATTLALLRLDAVVGVKGIFDAGGALSSVGIQCALCHSTVDDSLAPGIGRNGPGCSEHAMGVLRRGAALERAVRVDERTSPTSGRSLVPQPMRVSSSPRRSRRWRTRSERRSRNRRIGLAAGVNLHTPTPGAASRWNARGESRDARQGNVRRRAAERSRAVSRRRRRRIRRRAQRPGPDHREASRASRLPARAARAASSGRELRRNGRGARGRSLPRQSALRELPRPAALHRAGLERAQPAEIGIDDFQANRSPDKRYRTTPLAGLWTHEKGGFYHDGRFATLPDVVRHYDRTFALGLGDGEVTDLVEFLKSLPNE